MRIYNDKWNYAGKKKKRNYEKRIWKRGKRDFERNERNNHEEHYAAKKFFSIFDASKAKICILILAVCIFMSRYHHELTSDIIKTIGADKDYTITEIRNLCEYNLGKAKAAMSSALSLSDESDYNQPD